MFFAVRGRLLSPSLTKTPVPLARHGTFATGRRNARNLARPLPQSASQRSTIYALSTPPGRGGIGIIRISGPDARLVWHNMIVTPKRATPIPLPPSSGSRQLFRCRVVHPLTREPIDDGMAVFFHGPKSYTSEDTLEIHIHSGRAIIASALSSIASTPNSALRLAEPGEFTKRAFESGRIDLTEAEGIRDLIDAETESQRNLALRAAEGAVRERFEALRTSIIKVLASVEALIDFGEGEEIEEGVFTQARERTELLRSQIAKHLSDSRKGEILRSGIRLAIFGPPNAGKSSLLNYLAQRQAAIVTPLPGTTRDVLEVSLDIGGMPVIACDTAGLRESDDLVERIGVERASDVIQSADISLCLLSLPDLVNQDSSNETGIPSDVRKHITAETLVLLNKDDLTPSYSDGSLPIAAAVADQVRSVTPHVWTGSVLTSSEGGMDRFMEGLVDVLKQRMSLDDGTGENDVPLVTRARHREHLAQALLHLDTFLAYDSPDSIVEATEELRYAAREIGRISGSIDVEDVLDSIFRDFCIGK